MMGNLNELVYESSATNRYATFFFGLGTVALERGDVLVAFTDGISEAMNADEQEWGEERLIEAIVSRRALGPGDLIRSIMGEADSFVGGAPQARRHDPGGRTMRLKVRNPAPI